MSFKALKSFESFESFESFKSFKFFESFESLQSFFVRRITNWEMFSRGEGAGICVKLAGGVGICVIGIKLFFVEIIMK